MARDDAKKVFEHLEKAREASAPLKDPGLTKKIETAQEHIKNRVDPDKGSPKGIESLSNVSVSTHDACPKKFRWTEAKVHYISAGQALCGNQDATRFSHITDSISCSICKSLPNPSLRVIYR